MSLRILGSRYEMFSEHQVLVIEAVCMLDLDFPTDGATDLSALYLRDQIACIINCVVVLSGQIIDSQGVRSLFDLFKAVQFRRGNLFLVGYPMDYIDIIATLGFLDIPGLHLAADFRDIDQSKLLSKDSHRG
jgi:hypothetical protein